MPKYEKGSIGWLKELAKESGYPYEIKDNIVGPFIKWAKENGILKSDVEANRELHRKTVENAGCKTWQEYQNKCAQDIGYKDRAERQREYRWNNNIASPMSENEDCSEYFGIYLVEKYYSRKILELKFGGIEKEMPNNNPGYDYVVIGGYKIDSKARTLCDNNWNFPIRYNSITDYFLLWGFNNRYDLSPVYAWLIYKNEIIRRFRGNKNKEEFWRRSNFAITNSHDTLSNFEKYELKKELEMIEKYKE